MGLVWDDLLILKGLGAIGKGVVCRLILAIVAPDTALFEDGLYMACKVDLDSCLCLEASTQDGRVVEPRIWLSTVSAGA